MGDGDGGLERLLGRRCFGRIALEQDLAANAVEHGVSPVLAGLIRERKRLVDPAQGAVHVSCLGFEFRE